MDYCTLSPAATSLENFFCWFTFNFRRIHPPNPMRVVAEGVPGRPMFQSLFLRSGRELVSNFG